MLERLPGISEQTMERFYSIQYLKHKLKTNLTKLTKLNLRFL